MYKISFVKYINTILIINFIIIIGILGTVTYTQFQNYRLLKDFKEHPFLVSNTVKTMYSEIDTIWNTLHEKLYHKKRDYKIDFSKDFQNFESNIYTLNSVYLGDAEDINNVKVEYFTFKKNLQKIIKTNNSGKTKEAIVLFQQPHIHIEYTNLKDTMSVILNFSAKKAENFMDTANQQLQDKISNSN